MPAYGRQIIGSTGSPVEVTAEGNPPRPATGITLDWSTVPAATVVATLTDGTPVAIGDKVLEFGTVLTQITASGKYGPFASGAADGRQNVARSAVYILNMTTREKDAAGLLATASDFPDVIAGGLVWKTRIKMGGAGQPTVAAVEAALPLLRYVEGS